MKSLADCIIVALDVDTMKQVQDLVLDLKGLVGTFKVGKQLFTALGPSVLEWIHSQGEKVFLDLKFHDIPNTVAQACRVSVEKGVFMLNVHASGGSAMMNQAAEAVQQSGSNCLLIGVTVLTSLSEQELAEDVSCRLSLKNQVVHLAQLAQKNGLQGVVASPHEIALIRQACGESFIIVTPGVRPSWAGRDDQTRVMTPGEALTAGADYVVIGRPITQANNPKAAIKRIFEENI